MPNYLPYDERTPDSQYVDLVKLILKTGEVSTAPRQGKRVLTVLGAPKMKFDFANGFPVITSRDLGPKDGWRKSIGELCGFFNGATTAEELAKFGADWWPAWTTPEKCALFGLPPGELGSSSYGGAMTAFPTLDGETFNQVEALVEIIKNMPDDRVARMTVWMPKENYRVVPGYQKNTIAPCHGDVFVQVMNGRIHMEMDQRSCDVPVGGPYNTIQYAAFVLMLEQLTGFQAGSFTHSIWNAHIYEDQLMNMLDLVRREPRSFPTVQLTEAGRQITCITDFRREHFVLSDYHPHAAMRDIPVST